MWHDGDPEPTARPCSAFISHQVTCRMEPAGFTCRKGDLNVRAPNKHVVGWKRLKYPDSYLMWVGLMLDGVVSNGHGSKYLDFMWCVTFDTLLLTSLFKYRRTQHQHISNHQQRHTVFGVCWTLNPQATKIFHYKLQVMFTCKRICGETNAFWSVLAFHPHKNLVK